MAAISNEQNLQVLRVNHKEKMTEALESMFFEESLCDVTICCNGQSVKAHRVILAASSVYFKEIFATTQPGQYPIVFVKSISNEDLNAMLEFIYKGEVTVPQAQLESLVKSAETLGIIGLGKLNLKNQDFLSSNAATATSTAPIGNLPDQPSMSVPASAPESANLNSEGNSSNSSSSSSLHSSPIMPDDVPVESKREIAGVGNFVSDLNGTSQQLNNSSSLSESLPLPPPPNQPKKRGRKRKHLLNGGVANSTPTISGNLSNSLSTPNTKSTKLNHTGFDLPTVDSHSHSFGPQQPQSINPLLGSFSNTISNQTGSNGTNEPVIAETVTGAITPITTTTTTITHSAVPSTCDINTTNNHYNHLQNADSNDDSQPPGSCETGETDIPNATTTTTNGYNSSTSSSSSGDSEGHNQTSLTNEPQFENRNGKITKSKLRSWSQQISLKNYASVVRPGSSSSNYAAAAQIKSELHGDLSSSPLNSSPAGGGGGGIGSPNVDPNNNQQRPIKIEGRPRGRPRKIGVPKLNPMLLSQSSSSPLSVDSKIFKDNCSGSSLNASTHSNGTVTLSKDDVRAFKKESSAAGGSNSVKLVRNKHTFKAGGSNSKLSKSVDSKHQGQQQQGGGDVPIVKRGRGRPPIYPKITIDPNSPLLAAKPVVAPLSSLSTSSSGGTTSSNFPTAASPAPTSTQTNGLPSSGLLPPESAAAYSVSLSSSSSRLVSHHPQPTTTTTITSATSISSSHKSSPPALTPLGSAADFSESAVVSPVVSNASSS